MSLLDASIHSENRATDHHPSSCTLSVPPTPFHSSTITKRVFRKLNKSEISTFNDALQEIVRLVPLIYPPHQKYPPWYGQKINLSAQYHNTTASRIKPDSRAVKFKEMLSFYDSKGRAWGLDINLSKTELHSMGKAPQTTITAPSGKRLSTIDPKTLAPRKVYKYLGVYLFTDRDPTLTYELAKSEITSFFTFLHPLNFNRSEYIRLVNLQLIPTLQHRLMAHPLDQSQLRSLQNII